MRLVGCLQVWAVYVESEYALHNERKLCKNNCTEAAVSQDGEWSIHWSHGWWFNPQLLSSTCQSVLGQDKEPLNSPDGQASILYGSLLCAVCKGVCVNWGIRHKWIFWIKSFIKSQPFTIYMVEYLKLQLFSFMCIEMIHAMCGRGSFLCSMTVSSKGPFEAFIPDVQR